MLHDVFYNKFNNTMKTQMLHALQSRNSQNTTQLYNNNYKQNFIRKYGEKMASGVNSNTMRFISTTPNLYSKIEKMKQKGAQSNQIGITQREINTILGLPVTHTSYAI